MKERGAFCGIQFIKIQLINVTLFWVHEGIAKKEE